MATCLSCGIEGKKRATRGKRKWTKGFFRLKVLFYGEYYPDEAKITATFNGDLKQPVDTVLIIRIRLLISPLGDFASRLCKVVRVNS